MAHLAKYNKAATGHMIAHYERSSTATRKRDNIDETLTFLNYNLVMDTRTAQERLKDRLKDVYCMKRKDVNILCDWVVTAPKSLDENKQAEFFRKTYYY